MKRTLLFSVQQLFVAATASLLSCLQPLSAQESITLSKADYSMPTWTKLLRSSKLVDGNKPYSINMTINGDPTTSLGFAWFTNPTNAKSEVQIVKKANASEADFAEPTLKIAAQKEDISLNYLVDANGVNVGIPSKTDVPYTSHKAKAENLEAATTYSFRVGSEGAWSEIGSFTTAKADNSSFSFIYITDTQAQNEAMFDVSQKTIHAANRLVPDAQFVLCNGDFVETTGATKTVSDANLSSEWEWEQWFATMQDVWMQKPLVAILGNHDRSLRDSNFAKHFNTDNSYNQRPNVVATSMDGTVYSFVYGDALFMAINYEDYAKAGYLESLKEWMREQVKAHPNVKWRIATYHKNMFTGSRSHQDDSDGKAVREAMLPLFDELNIDIALQGHDHIYEVVGPVRNASKTLVAEGVQQVQVVGPGGARENMTGKSGGVFNVNEGTLYFLNNSAGKKKYEPRDESAMIKSLGAHGVDNYWGLFSGKFGQTGEPTFSQVNLSSDKIEISTYTVDDLGVPTLFDSFTVVKEKSTPNENISMSSKVVVTPNPASDVVRVSGVEVEKLEIFSMSGNLVKVKRNSDEVNIQSLPEGVYIVKITSGKDLYFSKVIKK